MRVFVAGATGVLGRAAVSALLAEGHVVVAAARNAERMPAVRRLGARAVQVDLYDEHAVADAIAGCDAVVRLTTRVPPLARMRYRSAWAETARLRTRGARVLVQAALDVGCPRYVHESVTQVYASGGEVWLDEQAPIDARPAPLVDAAAGELEVARFVASGGRHAVVLRFAGIYAADAPNVVELMERARARRVIQFGHGINFVPSVHARDAGRAVAAALNAPGGVYNVCDDEPLRQRDHLRVYAEAAHARPPFRLPEPLAPMMVGALTARLTLRSQRVSNRQFKETTCWKPEFPRLSSESLAVPIEES
jgi:nucleoside-diphosphate-sugar epimerase